MSTQEALTQFRLLKSSVQFIDSSPLSNRQLIAQPCPLALWTGNIGHIWNTSTNEVFFKIEVIGIGHSVDDSFESHFAALRTSNAAK